jgi:sugar phosphate isomerase/epimerase
MRLGGPVFLEESSPNAWIAALQQAGYRAAVFPNLQAGTHYTPADYAAAAHRADILIAEVGAWSNPISPNADVRAAAIRFCQERLALADEVGARCCVNIAGSRGERWDAPHPDNLSRDTFDLIVESVRAIVDAVQPTRTFYAIEMMPWIYPDSADSYLDLLHAIDRERVAVHLDPVNIVNNPRRYYENAALIRDCFARLGPYIKSCHAKDILLHDRLTVHLDEVRPGQGMLDYRTYLREIARLDPHMPLILEHLPSADEYSAAAVHIRSLAHEIGVTLT